MLRRADLPDPPRIKILRILLETYEGSGPYNLLTLPNAKHHDLTLLSYFKPQLTVPSDIAVCWPGRGLRAFLRQWKALIVEESYDLIHVHSPHLAFLSPFVRFLAGSFPPTIVNVHNSFGNFRPRNRLLFLFSFFFADKIVFCGKSAHDSFPEVVRRFFRKRIAVVPNAIDLSRIDRFKTSVRPSDQLTILYAGRLAPIKDVSTLLRAFHRARQSCPQLNLKILGQGAEEMQLKNLAQLLEISDRVDFLGSIPRDQVYKEMWASDIFASCSLGEGLPVAVIEAMACHLPLVLSDIPPHHEAGGDCARIASPGDVSGFSEHLIQLAAHPESLPKLGVRCRRHVEQEFGIEKFLRRYDQLFRKTIGGK